MTRLLSAFPALVLAVAGCSVIVSPGEVQCEATADCVARGFSAGVCVDQLCVEDPVWGCLGHVVEPVPDTTQKIAFSIRLAFAIGRQPLTVGKVDFCDKLDLECTAMNENYPKGVSPDKDGNVAVQVPQGFDGFVRIHDPSIVDSQVYVGRPLFKPPTVKEIRLLRPGEPELLAKSAKKTIDPARGMAIFLSLDCSGNAGSAVRFECPAADEKSDAFYLINQSPALPPDAVETDADGFGGFFNLPVGSAIAIAKRSKGQYIGQSTFEVLANTVSYVQISPTPK